MQYQSKYYVITKVCKEKMIDIYRSNSLAVINMNTMKSKCVKEGNIHKNIFINSKTTIFITI